MPRGEDALVAKRVPIKAVSKVRGDEYEHDVVLYFITSGHIKNSWILSIEGTPGNWYMSTLLENFQKKGVPEYIWIDWGTRWSCTNWRKVLGEAVKLI